MLAHINKSTKANDHSDSILFSQSDLISELWVLLKEKKLEAKMMQSLMSMKAYVGTRLPILTNSETSTRKQRVNCPNRRNVMVSCGSERNGNEGIGSNSGSFMSPSHNYAILKHRMEKAAKSEVSVFVFFFF